MTTGQEHLFTCFMRCYEMCRQYFGHDYSLDSEGELELLMKSLEIGRLTYEEYCISDLKKYFNVKVFVESPSHKYEQYSDKLENSIDPTYKILSTEDYIKAVKNGVAIVNMDSWYLNMISHLGHWVFLRDYKNGNFIIDDPSEGKEIEFPKERFFESIKSLKNRLSKIPVLIKVRENSEK